MTPTIMALSGPWSICISCKSGGDVSSNHGVAKCDDYIHLYPSHEHSVAVAPRPAVRANLRAQFCREQGRRVPRRSSRRSEEHTSELQSRGHLVCRLLLEKTKW